MGRHLPTFKDLTGVFGQRRKQASQDKPAALTGQKLGTQVTGGTVGDTVLLRGAQCPDVLLLLQEGRHTGSCLS